MGMFMSALPLLSAAPTGGEDMMVLSVSLVITGMVVVFAVLLLLVYLIKIYGSIIYGFQTRRAKRKDAKRAAQASRSAPPKLEVPTVVPITAALKPDAEGISGEVVAAISAAVATMTDGKGRVHSIRESKTKIRGSRPVWGSAGLLDSTRPF